MRLTNGLTPIGSCAKSANKCLTCSPFYAIIFEVMREENEMNKPYYYVRDEDGLYRMFDVSHKGLENAIKVARKSTWSNPDTCVMIHR